MPNPIKRKLADTPGEALNWRLLFAVLTFGLLGAARGLDEGLIIGTVTQSSFRNQFGLHNRRDDDLTGIVGDITTMVYLGSIGGALIAFVVCDKIGRIWATRQLCLIWIVGITVCVTSQGRLGQLLAGRFIAGWGIGQAVVVGPTYLAEIAPASIRGLCICSFSGAVYLGTMLGYFANWGASKHIADGSSAQWIVPTSMHFMFAAIIFAMTFGIDESPRWLVHATDSQKAAKILARLRHLPVEHPYVQSEILDIHDALERENDATEAYGMLVSCKELLAISSNRYRLALGIAAQVFSQWSGGSSTTLYAPVFLKIFGQESQSGRLLATPTLGVAKFVAALLGGILLVDLAGRRRTLWTGICLQLISVFYIAVASATLPRTSTGQNESASTHAASVGGVAFVYICGIGWAIGWNSIQYLINAEIFPLRIRALGTSVVMALHFVCRYGISRATPDMLVVMSVAGTFFFYTGITLLGLLWAWFFLPETSRVSLENLDSIFELPWQLIGRKGGSVTKGRGRLADKLEKEKMYRGTLSRTSSITV